MRACGPSRIYEGTQPRISTWGPSFFTAVARRPSDEDADWSAITRVLTKSKGAASEVATTPVMSDADTWIPTPSSKPRRVFISCYTWSYVASSPTAKNAPRRVEGTTPRKAPKPPSSRRSAGYAAKVDGYKAGLFSSRTLTTSTGLLTIDPSVPW